MEKQSVVSSRLMTISLGVLALFGLYLTSMYSYLLFHGLAELFSIVVAFAIFIIFWNARRFVDNSYFLFLAIAYLFVGVIDLIHTMAYPGMPIIQGSDTNMAAQLWIASRYIHSISLLAAPLLLGRKLRANLVLLTYAVIVSLLLGAILYWEIFPVCYVEGVGLTLFKIISEYIISLIFLASVGALYLKRREFDASVFRLLVAATMAAVASELAFTSYAHAYAVANLIGHLLKIVSFYLIYKAVIETGLVKPYDLLFRNLKREEEAVRESEALLSDLYEHAPIAYFLVGRDGLIRRWNDRAGELLGYPKEELLGKPVFEVYADTPQGKEKASQIFQRFLAGERITDEELQMQKADGTPVWISLTVNAVRDAQGQVVESRSMVVDITARKEADEALRQRTEDLDKRIKELNCLYGISRLVERPGISVQEILQGVVDLLPPAWRYPQIACARLTLEDWEFQTDNYEETIWQQTSDIFVHGERVGTVQVGYLEERPESDEGPFVKEEGYLIDAIAGRLGRIIERMRAQEQLLGAMEEANRARAEEEERRQEAERRRRIAESLADVVAVLNSNLSLDEVLDYIAAQAGELLGNQAAGIYRLEDGKLTMHAARGLLIAYAAGRDVPIGQEALRQAVESRQPVAVPDLGTHPSSDMETRPDTDVEPLVRTWAGLYQALLAVPIIVQDGVYGGIALYYSEPREFPPEEVELAAVFGDQIALAIENARLKEQVREAAAIAERERLARDLHDAVTQTLFSASLIAEALPRVWERQPDAAQRGLDELRQLTQGALAEMRTLLLELRPAALTEKPLGEILGHLATALTSRTRVPIALKVEGDSPLPADVQIALYRIAQEALNNMAKHSGASEASVTLLCESERVTLRIYDDGRGFDPSDILPDQLGLGIMHERAESIGASLTIESQPDKGTEVVVNWPAANGRQSDD